MIVGYLLSKDQVYTFDMITEYQALHESLPLYRQIMPDISVVIPTYDRCQYVQLAIDSALAQVEVDLEVIVIDDASTDGTGDILSKRYHDQIRYIRQENRGESVARNQGIRMASGAYIALLDSMTSGFLSKASGITVFERNPAHCLVFCPAKLIDSEGELIDTSPLGHEITELDLASEVRTSGIKLHQVAH